MAAVTGKWLYRRSVTTTCWVCNKPLIRNKRVAVSLCSECRTKRNRERSLAAYYRKQEEKRKAAKGSVKIDVTRVDWKKPRKRPKGKAPGLPGSKKRIDCYCKRIKDGLTVFSLEDEEWTTPMKATSAKSEDSELSKRLSKAEQSS